MESSDLALGVEAETRVVYLLCPFDLLRNTSANNVRLSLFGEV